MMMNTPLFSVANAEEANVCRICGYEPEKGPGLPFLFDHGNEHAHEFCLERYRDHLIKTTKSPKQIPPIGKRK